MSARAHERRRVVVTGLGAVTPLGGDAPSSWEGALAGRSGVGPLTRFDPSAQAVRIAAEVRAPLDPSGIPPKDLRRLDRFVLLAALAAGEALRDAELACDAGAPDDRFGVAIGSGIGGVGTLLENHRQLLAGERRLSPFFIPMTIANMAAGFVAIRHGLRGPNLCTTTACASGAHAIGEAARLIERGDADAMLAGGSEAVVNELVVAGFAALRALSTRNDEPERASRPFDLERDGFVVGEGAAVLVLEALDHARARGARPRAELAGYAAAADAGGGDAGSPCVGSSDCASQAAYIVIDRESGERTILWRRDPKLDIRPEELRPEMVQGARLLHVDGHDTAAAAQAARWGRAAGLPVTADVDNIYPGLDALLEATDYLVSSESFPAAYTGESDLFRALARIQERYPAMKLVAATLGRDGVLGLAGEGFLYEPAFDVPVRDTTGAGDVFHGAFIYALLEGWPLARILTFSNAVAGLNCTALGARGGIPTLAEAEALVTRGERRPPRWGRLPASAAVIAEKRFLGLRPRNDKRREKRVR